jgi:branched-subunit amino acid ABC-type transport system permease component
MALQFILRPVVEERIVNKFDKWDVFVYSIAGSLACIAGTLYRFGFPISRSIVYLVIAGALFGGIDKKLNPYIGGLVASFLHIWVTIKGMDIIGQWVGAYSIVIPIALIILSVFYYPIGIVGRFRKVVEYNY